MKTSILVLTVLLAGGLIFTSCKKDNDLLSENAYGQSYEKNNYGHPDSIVFDILKNYPDPFYTHTTIEFRLVKTSWVKLSVLSENTGIGVVLMQEIREKGVHTYDFNGAHLPAGEYLIEMKLSGGQIVKEYMVKKDIPTEENDLDPAGEE